MEAFSHGFSSKSLRLFFEKDGCLWEDVPSLREMRKLTTALARLLDNMARLLLLSQEDNRKLSVLFSRHAARMALDGLFRSRRSQSLPLYFFALSHSHGPIRERSIRLYPMMFFIPFLGRLKRALHR